MCWTSIFPFFFGLYILEYRTHLEDTATTRKWIGPSTVHNKTTCILFKWIHLQTPAIIKRSISNEYCSRNNRKIRVWPDAGRYACWRSLCCIRSVSSLYFDHLWGNTLNFALSFVLVQPDRIFSGQFIWLLQFWRSLFRRKKQDRK